MLEVWCASYLNTPERTKLLLAMLASLRANGIEPEHTIVMLSGTTSTQDFLDKACIYKHEKRVLQFDAYQEIFNRTSGRYQPDDWILFMDDDDLLLFLPPLDENTRVIQGTSLEYPMKPLQEEDLEQLRVEARTALSDGNQDFSGTLMRYDLVEKYFRARLNGTLGEIFSDPGTRLYMMYALERSKGHLEDCVFSTFAENYRTLVKPYIYVRNWEPDDPRDRASMQFGTTCASC